jgi:hypothetical protein
MGMAQHQQRDPQPIVEMRTALICRWCHSALEAFYAGGGPRGRRLELRCPRHGTLGRGERFFTGYKTVFGDERETR